MKILPGTVHCIQLKTAAELHTDGPADRYGSLSRPAVLINDVDAPQHHQRVVVELDNLQKRGVERLKIQARGPRLHSQDLPESFHHEQTRDVVDGMIKECGVRKVNVQGPCRRHARFADDHVAGEPVPHAIRRQSRCLPAPLIGDRSEPHPGIADGVHQPRPGGPRRDGAPANGEPGLHPQSGGSANVAL
jgi:hypothetical protein